MFFTPVTNRRDWETSLSNRSMNVHHRYTKHSSKANKVHMRVTSNGEMFLGWISIQGRRNW